LHIHVHVYTFKYIYQNFNIIVCYNFTETEADHDGVSGTSVDKERHSKSNHEAASTAIYQGNRNREDIPSKQPKEKVVKQKKVQAQVQPNKPKGKSTSSPLPKQRNVKRKTIVKQIRGSGSRAWTNEPGSKSKSLSLVSNVNIGKPQKPLALLTRTSPSTMVECVQCLNDDQKEAVKEMGFQGILGMKLVQSPAKLGYYLLDNLDHDTLKITTPNGTIHFTSKLVHEIFGIHSGGVDIDDLPVVGKESPLVSIWYSQFKSDKMTRGDIVDRIKEDGDSGIIFKMNFITLFVNCICKSYPSGFCIPTIVHKMAGNPDVSSMDWCSFVLNCVRGSKRNWKPNSPTNIYAGPITLLVVSNFRLYMIFLK